MRSSGRKSGGSRHESAALECRRRHAADHRLRSTGPALVGDAELHAHRGPHPLSLRVVLLLVFPDAVVGPAVHHGLSHPVPLVTADPRPRPSDGTNVPAQMLGVLLAPTVLLAGLQLAYEYVPHDCRTRSSLLGHLIHG